MALEAGTKLGAYEILSPIGAGGMGEVYRARDTKLGREVAVKVLPEALSQDKERLARFEREAKLLASLNHPGIATLFGLEEDAGKPFLVMELVEGETLSEQIARGPLPVEVALPLFQQIAEALEAAHEKAVIHRDLKPANIKVTPEGKVKVLDFGLAKAFAPQESEVDDSSQSPTLTKGTALGAIMGTASYMSPEQARGKPIDKRTDIWAFGCVLYEALTGKKAFVGETVSDTLSLILQKEPDWSRVPERLPSAVTRLLHRCLKKDRRQRLRDIGDAQIELGDVPGAPEPPANQRAITTPGRVIATVAVLAVAVLIGWFLRERTRPPSRLPAAPTTRSVIDLPPAARLALGTRVPQLGFDLLAIALSPDGSVLVYVGQTDGGTQLYRRAMDELEVSPIPGTEGAIHPFFSPDGEWVGFLTIDQVKKVSLQGGAPVTLANARTPTRGSWALDDTVYVAEEWGWRLMRVPAGGGTPSEVADLSGQAARVSQVLPGGRFALLTSFSFSGDYADVLLLSLETLETKVVTELGYDARYIPSGHILFARSGNVLAVPFDLARTEVTGEPVTVVSGVAVDSLFAHAQFTFSDNGSFVHVPGVDYSVGKLAWVDRRGNTEFLPVPERLYGAVDLAPDARRLAVQVADINDYIWIYDIDRQEGRKLTTGSTAAWPRWTPDGRSVAFSTGVPGKLLVQEVDGRSTPEELLAASGGFTPSSWTSDGRVVARQRLVYEIEFLSRGNTGAPEWTTSGQFGSFSPDDRWLAYASDETGRFEIWVRSFPDGDTVHQISVDYGLEAVWCQECDELFYRKGNQWMASAVSLSPELSWEPPRVVFQTTGFIDTDGISYDVTPDGQRLLVVKRTREPERGKLHVVVNWFEELERLVPTN